VENNSVGVDLYVELEPEVNVREVCGKIQSEIARAIQDMVSMDIEHIDVHVVDIAYDDPVG
jgi:uncharacterized alkaline shock family protein YloU